MSANCSDINSTPIEYIKIAYANRQFTGNNSAITSAHPSV